MSRGILGRPASATPPPAPVPPRGADDVIADLVGCVAELRDVERRRTELYARRLELWMEGRALDAPITQGHLAAISGVTIPAVIQQLKKGAAGG